MSFRLFLSKIYHNRFSVERRFEKWDVLDKSQWWPRAQVLKYQEKKLKEILEYAIINVPIFDHLKDKLQKGSTGYELLKEFPITDKAFYRNAGDLCRSKNAMQYHFYGSSTSGSTGESFYFDLDINRHAWAMAAKYRTDTFSGIYPHESRASLWGANFDNKASKSIKDRFRKYLTPFTFLSSYNLSETQIAKHIVALKKNQPKLLVSYPTPLVELAEYCKNKNIELPFLKSIICSSEQLFDFQRALIEEVFNVPVYNRYGTREFGSIAQQCAEREGLHINSERVFIEVLDDNDMPCAPGVKGQLVITDLDNKVMPLIRYRVGDFAAWSEDVSCDCKRGLPLLKFIEGRAFDVVRTPNGTVISGTFWTLLTKYVSKQIKVFQVVQNSLDTININIVTLNGGDLQNAEKDSLIKKIKEKDELLKVTISLVEHIELTKSGKRRFIISNI